MVGPSAAGHGTNVGVREVTGDTSMVKHVWQWYWDYDWLNKKYKAIYFGPRLDWMSLFKRKEKKNEKEKNLDGRKTKRSKKITGNIKHK
tara:strand:- start:686 stop:952 length:267 start_codon:yes stop_codon:yes gene_type:complete